LPNVLYWFLSNGRQIRDSKGYNPIDFMPDAGGLDTEYKTLTDLELLKLRVNGGFRLEAEQVLDKELARRNLTSDEAKRYFAPEWLDEANASTVGVLPGWVEKDDWRVTGYAEVTLSAISAPARRRRTVRCGRSHGGTLPQKPSCCS